MTHFFKRNGIPLFCSGSCLAALAFLNGCGGGGGGADLNLGLNGATNFAAPITLPRVNDNFNTACNGRTGDLQLSQVGITIDPRTNQLAVRLAAANIGGFTFSQGGFDPSTKRVNFRGTATDTAGVAIPVLFDGVLNDTRMPNSISGTLDFTCWRASINLVSQTGGTSPTGGGGTGNNGTFANAAPIGGPSGSINGNTVGDTGEPGEPNHACVSLDANGQVNSVWYNWTAPSTGPFKFFSTNTELGANAIAGTGNRAGDPTIAIYTGDAVNALTLSPPGAANDDNNNSGQPNVYNFCTTLNATSGQVYRIAIAAFGGDIGPFTLNWAPGTCTNPRTGASCPVVPRTGTPVGKVLPQ